MMFRANDRATGGVMKRNDWILITVVLAVSAIFLGIHFSRPQQKDGMAEVTIDGEVFGSWPISEDRTDRKSVG